MSALKNYVSVQVREDHIPEFLNELDREEKAILAEWGELIEGQAKAQIESAPRRVDTGRLKGSITYATKNIASSPEGPATGKDGVSSSMAGDDSVVIGTRVEYAIYVHEGTRKMQANRFLTNAVENRKSKIKEILVDHINVLKRFT